MIYLITGKRNAGKTHFAKALAKELDELQEEVIHIDGDAFRKEMGNYDFSDDGRILNLTNAAKQAQQYEREGKTVILSFVAPKQAWRDMMCSYWKEYKVIYIPGGTLWENTIYESPLKK